MGVILGAHSYGERIVISAYDGVVNVGKFCSIASGINAVFLRDHRVDWVTTYPFRVKWQMPVDDPVKLPDDINIGNDVWIGSNVTLLGGADIQDGAIVGAYSVVAGKITPYTVAVGNPARPVKKRFSDEEIDDLLKIKWWDWPEDRIKKFAHLLSSDNIQEFIRRVKNENI